IAFKSWNTSKGDHDCKHKTDGRQEFSCWSYGNYVCVEWLARAPDRCRSSASSHSSSIQNGQRSGAIFRTFRKGNLSRGGNGMAGVAESADNAFGSSTSVAVGTARLKGNG